VKAQDVLTLLDYNRWANRRLLEVAAALPAEQHRAPAEVPHGSLLGTFVHIFAAEQVWRVRCQEGRSPTSLASPERYPTLDALARAWEEEEGAMRAYLSSLTDADLEGTVHYHRTDGRPQSSVLWQVLAHLVNHGTQHRAEAALLLTRYGRSPGDLDLMVYLRQREQR
jgi:uncharacterized damage-inducible protein DinB